MSAPPIEENEDVSICYGKYPGVHRRCSSAGGQLAARGVERARRPISAGPPGPACDLSPESSGGPEGAVASRRRRVREGRPRYGEGRRWLLDGDHCTGRAGLSLLLVPGGWHGGSGPLERNLFRLGAADQRRGNPGAGRGLLLAERCPAWGCAHPVVLLEDHRLM